MSVAPGRTGRGEAGRSELSATGTASCMSAWAASPREGDRLYPGEVPLEIGEVKHPLEQARRRRVAFPCGRRQEEQKSALVAKEPSDEFLP